MPDLHLDFLTLFDSIIESEEHLPVYQNVLVPWAASHTAERNWLDSFASRGIEAVSLVEKEDLWQLNALSCVNDILLLCFQQGRADGSGWPGPNISLEEYLEFNGSLGFAQERVLLFSPFYHEIVKVDLAENDNQLIALTETLWPCLMLGNMMFSRAGVRVSGGKNIIRKDVAEMSTLYWSYRRKNRPYENLSQGWGHNSQWRTDFRRDCRFGQELYYNVDGKNELGVSEPTEEDRDGLTAEERIELLINRCFIRCTKSHNDLWPYDDRYRTKA